MTDTKPAKDAADVTEVPSGLDVAIAVPGTIVGSHDLQGADGTERTDRPGEILGTPAVTEASMASNASGRARETARTDYVTSEVDRANREELPLLGGTLDDGWKPGDAKPTKAAQAKADADAKAAPPHGDIGVTTAKVAAPADSGMKVDKTIDKG